MEIKVERRKRMGGEGDGFGCFFTEAELAAADQLVQLSASGEATAASASSPTSSTLSVNKGGGEAAARGTTLAAAEDDKDAAAWPMDRRARKRYRTVAELYEATRPAKRGGGSKRRNR